MNTDIQVIIVLCTAPVTEADRIAGILVRERRVACVNTAPVTSRFIWQGEECRDDENLLIMKTTRTHLKDLINRILEIHPYDVPEVIALPVIGGSGAYLDWVEASTQAP
ncbi:MAG: divalent-cation tolerance protein CutA [Methanomicrobiales archaeon]|nr:divalent-cation tolerance protein CutA [Methanomicrobiales archaeon]